MSDGDALLAAILANPDEDTPRLMYADWLDGRADNPPCPRAEFIRVQCELASNPELHGFLCLPEKPCRTCNRITSLFVKMPIVPQTHPLAGYGSYASRSLGSWDRDNPMFQFTRGFVSAVTCTSADWLTHADAIVVAHPVQKVTLTTRLAYGFNAAGRANIHGRALDHWVSRGEEYDHSERGIAKALCELEWPRIKFTVLSPATAPTVTYDDPFPDVPWGGGI